MTNPDAVGKPKKQYKCHVITDMPHTIYLNVFYCTCQKLQSFQENPKRTSEKLIFSILNTQY